jgi:hypothetical protein
VSCALPYMLVVLIEDELTFSKGNIDEYGSGAIAR